MPARPAVHAMCGLVGAGKSTVARRLALELPAVRLCRDEWMLRLVGGAYDDPHYVAAVVPCTGLIWEVAIDVLRVGSNVVLDWNHWSVELRRDAYERAHRVGATLVVHYVNASVDAAIGRAELRGEPYSHRITADGVRHMATLLEPPHPTEGFEVVVHDG